MVYNMRGLTVTFISVITWLISAIPAVAVDAPAASAATINSSIQIYRVTDLNFGTIVPSAVTGTVTLAPSSSYSSTGGILLVSGTPRTAAAFWAYGQLNRSFAITMPLQASPIIITNGTQTMTVDTFIADTSEATNNPGATGGVLNYMGMYSMCPIHIGAKLYVSPNQAVGIYTGTFNVTVAY